MPHRAIVNLAEWHRRALPLEPGERVLQFTTVSFDVAFQEIFTTWAEGGTLVLMDETLRRDPGALSRHLAKQKISRLFLPYVALQQLAEQQPLESTTLHLREVITAGEQLRITPQIRRFFSALEGCRLHNHYGPSETHVITAYTLPGNPGDWTPLPPIGCAIDGTAIELLSEELAPVAPGEIGELYAGGECLAEGYLGRPEQTANRFPLIRGVRRYRTGDLARQLPDGNFEFLGRADTQIKVRGFRIEPAEIELQLAGHSAVRECAVVAREQRLIAYWVGERVPPSALRSFLGGKLAPQLVPSEFVQLDQMPLTPSGKIDRRSLPDPSAGRRHASSGAPMGELEARIAAVWRDVLGVAQLGTEDNFFDLGGTSLTIVTAQRLLSSELRRDLDVTTLFQFPTISTLASHLRAGLPPGLSERSRTRAELQRAALARRRAPHG
jgi:acyl-coenzyme A synthetase/AMP-(fatty) acid ligase